MDLNSRGISLYVSRDSHGACAEMEAQIGELVANCHADNCPMGLFSCPLPCNCDEVTAETWAKFFCLDRGHEDEQPGRPHGRRADVQVRPRRARGRKLGMERLEKGQLVTVWGGRTANRRIRIFVDRSRSSLDGKTVYMCREPGEPEKDAVAWPRCAPLEATEPEAFLGRDRFSVGWLCALLAKRTHTILDCPPGIESGDACECGGPDCAQCWEKASLEAVMEGKNGPEG